MVDLAVAAAVIASIVVAFVVVPELLERRGMNPRSRRARAIVWITFLGILFVPAAATGYLFSITNPVDWVVASAFLVVAVLWDYYRLNPDRIPWSRRR